MNWKIPKNLYARGLLILILIAALNPHVEDIYNASQDAANDTLYLKSKAAVFVRDIDNFEIKVREVSQELDIAPSWLMAVMHSESQFDGSVENQAGSGATGLIQILPQTAEVLDISLPHLRNLNPIEQMEYAQKFLNMVKQERNVEFDSLTDLYLAILYPKAVGQRQFTLYQHPEAAYTRNKGLDINKDGKVTTEDIEERMAERYPEAFAAAKPLSGSENYAGHLPLDMLVFLIGWTLLFIKVEQLLQFQLRTSILQIPSSLIQIKDKVMGKSNRLKTRKHSPNDSTSDALKVDKNQK